MLLDLLLSWLPDIQIAFAPGWLRPWLRQLPTIYAIVDRAVAFGYQINGGRDWSEHRARQVIYATIEAIADGSLTALEVARLFKEVDRRYSVVAAAKVSNGSDEGLNTAEAAILHRVLRQVFS